MLHTSNPSSYSPHHAPVEACEAGSPIDKAVRRLACARCHTQKLRCPRKLGNTRDCTRCMQAQVKCVDRPWQKMGRPSESNPGRISRKKQRSQSSSIRQNNSPQAKGAFNNDLETENLERRKLLGTRTQPSSINRVIQMPNATVINADTWRCISKDMSLVARQISREGSPWHDDTNLDFSGVSDVQELIRNETDQSTASFWPTPDQEDEQTHSLDFTFDQTLDEYLADKDILGGLETGNPSFSSSVGDSSTNISNLHPSEIMACSTGSSWDISSAMTDGNDQSGSPCATPKLKIAPQEESGKGMVIQEISELYLRLLRCSDQSPGIAQTCHTHFIATPPLDSGLVNYPPHPAPSGIGSPLSHVGPDFGVERIFRASQELADILHHIALSHQGKQMKRSDQRDSFPNTSVAEENVNDMPAIPRDSTEIFESLGDSPSVGEHSSVPAAMSKPDSTITLLLLTCFIRLIHLYEPLVDLILQHQRQPCQFALASTNIAQFPAVHVGSFSPHASSTLQLGIVVHTISYLLDQISIGLRSGVAVPFSSDPTGRIQEDYSLRSAHEQTSELNRISGTKNDLTPARSTATTVLSLLWRGTQSHEKNLKEKIKIAKNLLQGPVAP